MLKALHVWGLAIYTLQLVIAKFQYQDSDAVHECINFLQLSPLVILTGHS